MTLYIIPPFIVHNSFSPPNSNSYLSQFLYSYMKMKMREKATIFLFWLLFAFFISSLPSTTAVPSSRSLKSVTGEYTSNQHLYHEIFQVKKGRMGVELSDYSGTGANNHHDPKSPPESV